MKYSMNVEQADPHTLMEVSPWNALCQYLENIKHMFAVQPVHFITPRIKNIFPHKDVYPNVQPRVI